MNLNISEMPRMLFFDTETTGFNPGNICQLSYVIVDGEEVIPKNYYFKVDYVDPGAQRVHGLSVNKLIKLSGNREFVDFHNDLYDDFENADLLIAHNFSFDIRFIRSEFMRCGINYIYNESLCTMKYFTNICRIPSDRGYGYKWPKLEELVKYFRIKEKRIIKTTEELFDCKKIDYHDARFDTVATYLCFMEAMSQGLVKLDRAAGAK
ncbi:MAG: 3'-5' exonuclease [Tissierellia bacterium]|nr:3'-5' exonuclease [Tissierellia bacterium]